MTAAFSRLEFGIVGRTRGTGRAGSAVAAAAYNLCARLDDGSRRYDYSRKGGEHTAGCVLLPPGAPPGLAEPGALWLAAEAAERRADAQLARQVLLSIPREVPAADRLAFAAAIAAPWIADGAGVQIDVHCPTAADGGEQPHAHLLLTLRRVTDAGLATVKCREWNELFREDGGRAERARVQARGNAWLTAHGIAGRLDLRSLAAQGDDQAPEPTAPRAAWQRWTREGADPGAPPPAVADVLAHRARRAALAEAVETERRAAAAITAIRARLADLDRTPVPTTPQPQESTTMARAPRTAPRRPQPPRRPAPTWHLAGGGYDALAPARQAEADASYARWTARRPAGAQAHDVRDYVAYVQGRRADEQADDAPDGAPRARPTEAGNSIGPADDRTAGSRRARVLADLLREHYAADWLPATAAARLVRVDLDRAARTATLRLRDGSTVVDHGDRLTLDGPMTDDAVAEIAEAAARHGWPSVRLTGTADFRDRVTAALALREPPIPSDHTLSPAARARVRDALRERAEQTVPTLDRGALAVAAAADPAAAARLWLAAEDARAAAGLAGRPSGEEDSAVLGRPREAAITTARDAAVRTAIEATGAADGHRREHGITARLFDASVRRRQAALDAEASRLGRVAQRLDRSHDHDRVRAGASAIRDARTHREAVEDWRWSAPVRAATARAAVLDIVRAAVEAGDPETITAAAEGDADRAVQAAAKRDERTQAERAAALAATEDPRAGTVAAAIAAEAKAGANPSRLAAARTTTAAVLAGDPAVTAAVHSGRLAEAARLAADWRRRQETEAAEARRRAAPADDHGQVAVAGPVYR